MSNIFDNAFVCVSTEACELFIIHFLFSLQELSLLERVLHDQTRPTRWLWWLAGCRCNTTGDQ